MAQLSIEIPEDLARRLEGLAIAQNKSVEEVALERLQSLLPTPGSPSAVLRAMREQPHLSSSVVDDLEAAIGRGRLAVREQGAFEK